MFGSDVTAEDVYWHDGWLMIDEVAEDIEYEDDPEAEAAGSRGPILEGSRNNTMSRFAGRVLKRYGICDKAHEVFLEMATKCDPPLAEQELKTIWSSAVKFYKNKVMTSEGYVPPDEYNEEFAGASLKPDDYSDIGEAKVLTREYGDELKFTKATDYLRYDGECWREDKEMALGAAEEFLDLQLADAKDEVDRAVEALVSAGIPEPVARTGGAALQKIMRLDQMGLFYMLMSAQAYLKFVMKYRNYKNIVNTQNAAKPMLAIDVNELDTVVNTIKNTVGTVFNNMLSTIKSIVGNIAGTIKSGFQAAISYITSLPSQALKWGRDIIDGIVDGIKGAIGKVKDAVGNVAETIKSFLHFSVPDEGPLTDYETWMPDFMHGLAKGINQSKSMVAKAMDGVASDMVLSPSMNAAALSDGGAGSSGETLSGITSAITAAIANVSGQNGDIVIPVYLGGTMLDEVIVNAQQRANLRSGGR